MRPSSNSLPGKDSKIVLTPSGTVKISSCETSSTPSTSCSSPISSSQQSLYSALDNDDFDEGIMDSFDAQGKIHVDDELHLIGEGTRNSPFLSPKVMIMLVLNLIFISLSITWLIGQNFRLDLIGTIFISLAAWTLFVNCVMALKMIRRAREHSILAGKPDDFRDYVTKLQSTQQPAILIRSDKYSPASYFSNNNSNNRVGHTPNAPIFV